MRLNYDQLMSLRFAEKSFGYTATDTILYALAVGMGRTPDELRYVYEDGLIALPTLATVIAWDDTWQEETGMDISRIVHGGMQVTLHRPLAPSGRVVSSHRIAEAIDKGPGRGAILLAETVLRDKGDGAPVATLLSTVFARGDGGFGGPERRAPEPKAVPERPADLSVSAQVRPEQALLYRLCGDRNPLHADPAVARAAGFDEPILQGLCSYGIATGSVIRALCPDVPDRVRHVEARFTAPVYPDDTLTTDIWRDPKGAVFRCRVERRDAVALDNGFVTIIEGED